MTSPRPTTARTPPGPGRPDTRYEAPPAELPGRSRAAAARGAPCRLARHRTAATGSGPVLPTRRQELGLWGEKQVCQVVPCPICNAKGLTRLTANFPSLDLVCRRCGAYMAQVKTHEVDAGDPDARPTLLRGSGWVPLQQQMRVGQMRDMYIVGAEPKGRSWRLAWVDLLPGQGLYANAQVFVPRTLSPSAKRAGHRMFDIDLSALPPAYVVNVCKRPATPSTGASD